jgi:hypothetical protein
MPGRQLVRQLAIGLQRQPPDLDVLISIAVNQVLHRDAARSSAAKSVTESEELTGEREVGDEVQPA